MTKPGKHLAIVLIAFIAAAWGAAANAQLLSNPESVVFDSLNNRYLVSNCGTGMVAALTDTDTTATPFRGMRGLFIRNNILYTVATNTQIHGYDLVTQDTVLNVTIPGAMFLNDLTCDGNGLLYITDTDRNRMYKLNSATSQLTNFVSSGITAPNGIYFDGGNNRLLLVSWRMNSPIQAVSIADSAVSTVASTILRNLDGITRDAAGNYYVSSWTTSRVYKFSSTFTNQTVFSANHSGPADIYYDRWRDLIAVPNYNLNTVEFISVTGVEQESAAMEKSGDGSLRLDLPGANPRRGPLAARYYLAEPGKITLALYDASGRRTATIANGFQGAGWHRAGITATRLGSGVHFVRLSCPLGTVTRRIVLLR